MPRIRGLIGILLFAGLWQFFSASNSLLLPALTDIISVFFKSLVEGDLLRDIIDSTCRVVAGVCVALSIALPLGILSSLWKSLPEYCSGLVEMIRPIPPIAWAPIAIIAFGIGDAPAIAIVALGAFFPLWFGIVQGLKNIKGSHLYAAKSLGANYRLVFTDIIVPSVMPFFLHGLRLSVGLGWFCVVAAEMLGASSGLGYAVQLSSLNLEMERLYTYLVTIGLTGYISNSFLMYFDTRYGSGRHE